MTLDPVDLLVFGPHPDDIEIGLGGTVARHSALGFNVGLCDLTAGELGSNGTIEERIAEADAARAVLGARWRINLRWPDRGITAEPDRIRRGVALIREVRPRVVAIPYWEDRHPDHVAASRVLMDVIFNSGLRRYHPGTVAWKPGRVCFYFINDMAPPSLLIDVSEHYAAKRRALACHRTQFTPTSEGAVSTRLTTSSFQQLIESRDAQFGALAGVPFAEGVVQKDPMLVPHLL
jgi:bacillithiol biosynthesis deacetylase BshB1